MKYENWLRSKEKWEKIVKNIRNRNKYDYWDSSFHNIKIASGCGYCRTYDPHRVGDCILCPLYKAKMCSDEGNYSRLTFWTMIRRLENKDYKAALPLAKKILDFIINDEPERS